MRSLSERTIGHNIEVRIKQQRLERNSIYQQYKDGELISAATPLDANWFEQFYFFAKRTLIRLTPARHYYHKAEH